MLFFYGIGLIMQMRAEVQFTSVGVLSPVIPVNSLCFQLIFFLFKAADIDIFFLWPLVDIKSDCSTPLTATAT